MYGQGVVVITALPTLLLRFSPLDLFSGAVCSLAKFQVDFIIDITGIK
jgi:hypothetical protein